MSKYLYSLGLMSGTSVDGVDASIIKSDGEQFLEIIDDIYLKYDDNFRIKLKKIIDSCNSKDEFNNLSSNIKDIVPVEIVNATGVILHGKEMVGA